MIRAHLMPKRKRITVSAFLLGLGLILGAFGTAHLSADIPCVWTGIDKIIAVGDLHGDYDNFVTILIGTGLVDESLQWAAGTTHFVQIGDTMDRGHDAKRIFDLLMRLEKEAREAGGMVHVLLGNHEEMNLTGIAFSNPEYVTVEQFLSFLPPDYRLAKEKSFLKSFRRSRGDTDKKGSDPAAGEKARQFWQALMKSDKTARRMYMAGFDDPYAKWLLEKNAIIRINDIIFVHGGISEKLSTWKLEAVNSLLRDELRTIRSAEMNDDPGINSYKPKIVYDREGPLWFRGLALGDEKTIEEEFERILDNLGAGHMVVGHTIQWDEGASPLLSPRFLTRFDGKLWIIDTGISDFYGGINSALIIDKGDFVLWGDEEGEVPEYGVFTQENGSPWSTDEVEKFLQSSRIDTIVRSALRGRTEPWTIILDDGETVRKAVFKYIDRRRPSLLADSYRYELAAYALDKLLGLGIVPPAVQREIDGLQGSLQLYVENAITEAARRNRGPEPPDATRFREALDSVKAFALLVNDKCENLEDTHIEVETWRVRRVDFSEAFGPSTDFPPDCSLEVRPEEIYRKLRGLDDRRLEERLAPVLNENEIRALIQRKARLLRLMEKMTPAPGSGV